MNNSNAIGVFDSGVGGTSIWKEINKLLPFENTIYLSDSINAPYGEKSKEEIIKLSVKNTEFLLQQKCKIIVVACNTATTNAINYLRANYSVPFIGIEPAIKPASLQTLNKKIGILATNGTLSSDLFADASKKINQEIEIIEQVGEGLVELIENNKINSEEMTNLLKFHLQKMIKKDIDCLVLGCTHYPYLIPKIQNIIGNKIQIIDSGQAVAKQTKAILVQNNILNLEENKQATHQFYINKSKNTLVSLLKEYQHKINIETLNF